MPVDRGYSSPPPGRIETTAYRASGPSWQNGETNPPQKHERNQRSGGRPQGLRGFPRQERHPGAEVADVLRRPGRGEADVRKLAHHLAFAVAGEAGFFSQLPIVGKKRADQPVDGGEE